MLLKCFNGPIKYGHAGKTNGYTLTVMESIKNPTALAFSCLSCQIRVPKIKPK